MMSRHQSLVATSISCRDISSSLLQPSTGRLLCRDLNLLSRHQLMSLEPSLVVVGVATSVPCHDNSLSYISFIFPNLSWLQGASLIATSIPCRDINFCLNITMLARHHSFSFCSSLSCLSYDPCRDLHQIPSIFLMSRPHNWTVRTQTSSMNQPVAFISALPFDCTFTPLIAAFFYRFFFFLSLFLLITNW